MILLAVQHFPAPDTQAAIPHDERGMRAAHDAIVRTRNWLSKAVIGLNLCPFAKAVHIKNQIRYAVSDARDEDALCADLVAELKHLAAADPETLDTTVLIHPAALNDFHAYNDFLGIADDAVAQLGLEGVLQIASFHPAYQFADAAPGDISNYTNRSPYPILHLLREASIERAVDAVPDAADIYERNIETLRRLGHEGWQRLDLD